MDGAESELSFFYDRDEAIELINTICGSDWQVRYARTFDKLVAILVKYQEQPILLNSSLGVLLAPLTTNLITIATSIHTVVENNKIKSPEICDKTIPDQSQLHAICKTLQLICRVRGFKHVIKLFPHEVSHFELCITLLHLQNRNDFDNWETQYILLLWLSTLGLIPFDLTTLDSSDKTITTTTSMLSGSNANSSSDRETHAKPATGTLITTIVHICKSFLSETGLTREAAAYCLAGLLSRPDLLGTVLEEVVNWACKCMLTFVASSTSITDRSLVDVDTQDHDADVAADERAVVDSENKSENPPETATEATVNDIATSTSRAYCLILGVMQCLAQTLKKCERQVFIHQVGKILSVLQTVLSTKTTPKVRKFATKIVQRIGLVILPVRVAKWRYQRGHRSLLDNLKAKNQLSPGPHHVVDQQTQSHSDIQHNNPGSSDTDATDEDDALCEAYFVILEDIIDVLITNLQDKDTIVRWSAAKGIGRITIRLPLSFADDVVNAVLEVFQDKDADAAWHGGCLALAELARRGLLLPNRLHAEVLPLIQAASNFDVVRGQHSVGSHVRDASCYTCWAFARAYSPEVIRPLVELLSSSLLVTTLFDREINCRRAAAAAYQENVGRQGAGVFPFGIEIIGIADFFSVGNRAHTYLQLSVSIAAFSPQLHAAFIFHLRKYKISHWDADMRQLAAKALAKLVLVKSGEVVRLILELLPECTSASLTKRHGAVIAIAEILLEASHHSKEPIGTMLGQQLCISISEIVSRIEKARLYRGRGGEILRCASCFLIENIAASGIGSMLSLKTQVALIDSLNENVKQPHQFIQLAAASAVRQAVYNFFCLRIPAAIDSPENESHNSTINIDSSAVSCIRPSQEPNQDPTERLQQLTILKYITGVQAVDGNVAVSRGSALALGALPCYLLTRPSGQLEAVLAVLIDASAPTAKVGDSPDADTRRNAIHALSEILDKLEGLCEAVLGWEVIHRVFLALVAACGDYSIDSRGDVGSWIRSASLVVLEKLLYLCMRKYWNAAVASGDHDDNQRIAGDSLTVSSTCMSPHGVCMITDAGMDTREGDGSAQMGLVATVLYPNPSCGNTCYDIKDTNLTTRQELDRNYSRPRSILRSQLIPLSANTQYLRLVNEISMPLYVGTPDRQPTPASPIPSTATVSTCPTPSCSANNSAETGTEIWRIISLLKTMSSQCVSLFLKQLAEKLDNVREVAGGCLQRVLSSSHPICSFIPHRSQLLALLKKHTNKTRTSIIEHSTGSSTVAWSQPATAFPFLVDILEHTPYYFDAVLSGLVLSIGCLTETTQKSSSHLLVQFALKLKSSDPIHSLHSKTAPNASLRRLGNSLVQLFHSHTHDDRVIVPLLKTVGLLMRNSIFEATYGNELASELLPCISSECNATNDVKKIILCSDMFVLLMLCDEPIRSSSYKTLVILLGHKYPKVRKYVAELLYLQLQSDSHAIGPNEELLVSTNTLSAAAPAIDGSATCSDQVEQPRCGLVSSSADLDKVCELLVKTPWEGTTAVARAARQEYCDLAGLVMRRKTPDGDSAEEKTAKKKSKAVKSDELDSYEALVREAGY